MADRDTYRCMSTGALLQVAREDGIDAELAVALAERLEHLDDWVEYPPDAGHAPSRGGRYNFNHRSEA